MKVETLNEFRNTLASHRDALLEWLANDSPQKYINLGNAEVSDVMQMVSEIKDVLEQIENGQFGFCTECNGEVETERLELDFTEKVCLDHYTDTQIRALEGDLELAAKVQRQLLPHCTPCLSGIDIYVHSQPARIVSGDYYDFFSYEDGTQGIVMADVMGKGLPASMLMSNLQASLRILGPEYKDLNLLAARLNELFRYNLKLIRFISIFLSIVDTDAGTLQYCNAGHNPAIWWEASTASIRMLEPTGPAVGLIKNPEYESREIHFHHGDLLVFYTDGLVESQNSNRLEFGQDRLVDFIKNHHHNSAENILTELLDTVKNFSEKLHDDITILIMKVQ